MTPLDAALAAARLAQYAGVSLAGGGALYQLYGVRTDGAVRFAVGGALAGLIGAIAWLALQAISIAGDPAAVADLATGTGFGRATSARMGLLAIAGVAATRRAWVATAAAGLAAAGSLAWSGHGAADGVAHLAADGVHAIAAAVWIGALAMLSGAIARQEGADEALTAFSRLGPWVVGALAISGAANSWFLVGLDALPGLPSSPYGRLLIAKLALFAAMLVLAALNRWRFAPAVAAGRTGPASTSVALETLLGLGVLAVAAWLGTTPPPMS